MIVYQVVFRAGKYRIRKRTVRVEKGEFRWPGPIALHPRPETVHRSFAAARRWQASKGGRPRTGPEHDRDDRIGTVKARYFRIPKVVTLNSRRESDLTNRHLAPAVLQRS